MDRVASNDQAEAACRTMAEMCAMFRDHLVQVGFKTVDAQRMVELWMVTMMEKHDTRNL